METANNFNELDLNTKELLNFTDELEQLSKSLGDEVLKTLDEWNKNDNGKQKILEALGITQWIQRFENNSKIKEKLKEEGYEKLFEKLCSSWRGDILAEKLDDKKNFNDIYKICQKLNNWGKEII